MKWSEPPDYAGETALSYFQESFPHSNPLDQAGSYQNPAEWIVDLTTKVSLPPIHTIYDLMEVLYMGQDSSPEHG